MRNPDDMATRAAKGTIMVLLALAASWLAYTQGAALGIW